MNHILSCTRFLCFGLFLSMLMALPPSKALSAHIVIDSAVVGNVAGNGTGANGTPPFDGDPNGNAVVITNSGSVAQNVYGGNSSSFGATGNSVRITGGSVGVDVYGGWSNNGAATGNSVSITGGSVNWDVYGGWTGNQSATYNTVTISGGTVGGDVYGGYVNFVGPLNVTHNTVTLSGTPNLSASGIFGGFGGGDVFTGNTLNVWNYSGTPVASVSNFQYYNFILPASLAGLNVTGTVNFKDPNSAATSTVTGVSIMGGGAAPQPGQQIQHYRQ